MGVSTREDWWELADRTVPLLTEYCAKFGLVDPNPSIEEIYAAAKKTGDHALAKKMFDQIWSDLPDSPAIRVRPFFDLCDLCSEYWVFYEEEGK